MKLAVTVCATKQYAYALAAQLRRVQKALRYAEWKDGGTYILVTNDRDVGKEMTALCKSLLPEFEARVVVNTMGDGHKNYKEDAQMLIAQMRTAAFSEARALDVDYCWSLDSDVLPPANGFACMLWSLGFDRGYYSIACCPYPSQGGGGFLGGRGTIYQPILPDWQPEERQLPEELLARINSGKTEVKSLEAAMEALRLSPETDETKRAKATEIGEKMREAHKSLAALDEEVKKCPPKGNIFEVNGKGWKRRGWLDNCYPAIGKGAMLPSDWCGFGCTLMGRAALAEADFIGYEGRGTEDLYIVWNRWYKAGMRINVITHAPADHVIRNPGKPGRFCLMQATHETEGEYVGHLRYSSKPWYPMELGEKFDPANDGILTPAPEEKKAEPAAPVPEKGK